MASAFAFSVCELPPKSIFERHIRVASRCQPHIRDTHLCIMNGKIVWDTVADSILIKLKIPLAFFIYFSTVVHLRCYHQQGKKNVFFCNNLTQSISFRLSQRPSFFSLLTSFCSSLFYFEQIFVIDMRCLSRSSAGCFFSSSLYLLPIHIGCGITCFRRD